MYLTCCVINVDVPCGPRFIKINRISTQLHFYSLTSALRSYYAISATGAEGMFVPLTAPHSSSSICCICSHWRLKRGKDERGNSEEITAHTQNRVSLPRDFSQVDGLHGFLQMRLDVSPQLVRVGLFHWRHQTQRRDRKRYSNKSIML